MSSTFNRKLESILRENGCEYIRTGRHDMWYSPISNRNFPVPNNIVSRDTANVVLKQAGLSKQF